ncbi:hypothetical protein Btru_022775 [Bulinus truncatus]|nr:hypothetical protein Btru_022775 [Bulinus truncatus]
MFVHNCDIPGHQNYIPAFLNFDHSSRQMRHARLAVSSLWLRLSFSGCRLTSWQTPPPPPFSASTRQLYPAKININLCVNYFHRKMLPFISSLSIIFLLTVRAVATIPRERHGVSLSSPFMTSEYGGVNYQRENEEDSEEDESLQDYPEGIDNGRVALFQNNPDDVRNDALQDLSNLISLYMDGLMRKEFGSGFTKMKSLRKLTLSGYSEGLCRLKNIARGTFQNLRQLTFLNISNCYINGLKITNSSLEPLVNLKTLDLTYNVDIGIDKLITILSGLRAPNLTHLYISSVVTRFSKGITINKKLVKSLPPSLTHLVAKENCFESVDSDIFSILPEGLKYINLGSNRLLFGSYLETFSEMRNLEHLEMSRDNFIYNLPSQYPFTAENLHVIDTYSQKENYESDSTNTYEMDHFRLWENSESNAKLILKLPPNMTRLDMNTASLHYFLSELNISENNILTHLSLANNFFPKAIGPITGLNNLQSLNLSHCSVQIISESFFQYFPNLTVLNLGYNNLKTLLSDTKNSAKFFRNLTRLTYLDLSNNQLHNMYRDIFYGLDNLEQLHLESNKLSNFSVNIFHMKKLNILNISDSQLPTLPISVREHITFLRDNLRINITVDMSVNPIQCDCNNLDFLEWMVQSKAFGKRFSRYQCFYPDKSIKSITDGYVETISTLKRQCMDNYYVFLIVSAVTLAMIALVSAGIAYRFRWKIRYLYYTAYLKVKQGRRNEDQSSFKFDVFLSYSHLDEQFVLARVTWSVDARAR